MFKKLLGLLAAIGVLSFMFATPAQADLTSSKAEQIFNIQGQGDHQLNSKDTKIVFCQMKKEGFNGVALNFTLEQKTRTSSYIYKRTTVRGRSGTPTDDQLRQATRNAKACGLTRIYYKPHLELSDSTGGWRGRIGTKGSGTTDVRNAWTDKQNEAWHEAWRAKLVKYAKIGVQEKFTGIVIGTEQWGTTLETWNGHTLNKNNGKRWAATAKEVKKVVGSKRVVSYAPHMSYEARGLPTTFCRSKYLDRLDPTWYPKQQSADKSVAKLYSDMDKDFKKYWEVVAKRCGKPMVPAEVGFLSLKYESRDKQYNGATWRDVDQELQANQYRAFIKLMDSKKMTKIKVRGAMLYRVTNNPRGGGAGDIGFTWQQKQAALVLQEAFRK